MLLRRIAVLLAALATMVVMSVPPVMAYHEVGHTNHGNKGYDGGDPNEGGGQEAPKKAKSNQGGDND